MEKTFSKADLQTGILRMMYDALFDRSGPGYSNLHRFAEDNGYDRGSVEDAFDDLNDAGLAEYHAAGGEVIITTLGIMHVEEMGIADADLIIHQEQVRTKMADAMVRLHDEHGRRAHIDWTLLVESAGVEQEDFNFNYRVLCDLGIMCSGSSIRAVDITEYGRQVVQEYRQRCAVVEEFGALDEQRDMTPQERGRRFERVLDMVIARDGWTVEAGVVITGEQNDLIINKGNDYYLIEAKWEKTPADPEKVSRLFHKMSKRPGMKGVMVSMSGYTDAALTDVHGLLMKGCLILLYGPCDVELLLKTPGSFTETLEAKTRAAMTRCEVLVA